MTAAITEAIDRPLAEGIIRRMGWKPPVFILNQTVNG